MTVISGCLRFLQWEVSRECCCTAILESDLVQVFWVTPGFQGESISTESAVQSEKCNGASAGGTALSKGQGFNIRTVENI